MSSLSFSLPSFDPISLKMPIFEGLSHQVSQGLFKVASYLTEMPCNARQSYWLSRIVDPLYPASSNIEKTARRVFLQVQMACYGTATLFTGIPAILLRQLGIALQSKAWVEQGSEIGKILSGDKSFSVLSWNICGVRGGYAITDGGVVPLEMRMDAVLDQIIQKDADVNCLCEVFDREQAEFIAKRLQKQGYNHFYYNIHPLPVGLPSGLFVASKYKMSNPEFVRFPLETLVGRTKNAAKGVFFFDLESEGKVFATGATSHMQHSEECEFPTEEEVLARKAQMQIIKDKIDLISKDRIVFLNGDLNGVPSEIRDDKFFESGNLFGINYTWGGDEAYVKLVEKAVDGKLEKRISGPLFYDYSMIRKQDQATIHTSKVSSHYNPKIFSLDALSDHDGLFSKITPKKRTFSWL